MRRPSATVTTEIPRRRLLPQGHRIGADIGANAETFRNTYGCRSASVNAPCPPIKCPKVAHELDVAQRSELGAQQNRYLLDHVRLHPKREDKGASVASK